jgi:DNA-binding response OmpR family regulator
MSPAENPMTDEHPAAQPVVLVVEDEVLIRLATADYLRENGFKVVEAATGGEAQELILAGLKPDLVFSDITMPGSVDGVALARWLSAQGVAAPVMLVSGVTAVLEEARAECANVRAIAIKPYDYDQILARIRALLSEATEF